MSMTKTEHHDFIVMSMEEHRRMMDECNERWMADEQTARQEAKKPSVFRLSGSCSQTFATYAEANNFTDYGKLCGIEYLPTSGHWIVYFEPKMDNFDDSPKFCYEETGAGRIVDKDITNFFNRR